MAGDTCSIREERASRRRMPSAVYELDAYGVGNDTRLVATREQESDCLTPSLAIVECPVIDVHPDEGVGFVAIKSTRVLHGVVERCGAVLQ